jgi:hypothetical protein
MKEIKADIADTIKRNEYAGTVTSNEWQKKCYQK